MIYATDTETTGLSNQDQVIELALMKIPSTIVSYHDSSFLKDIIEDTYPIEYTYCEQFNPSVPIDKRAQECHGISKRQLLGKRPSSEVKLPADTNLLVGHNTAFDKRMLKVDTKHICVWRMAQKIEKQRGAKFGFTNYQLFTMLCFFYPNLEDKFKTTSHRALVDTRMTVLVLIKLLEAFPFLETLYEAEEYFFGENGAKKK